MTVKELNKILEDNNIPQNATLQSDSGWECSETEMDGVWYNKSENRIIFTQEPSEFDRYFELDGWINISPKKIKTRRFKKR